MKHMKHKRLTAKERKKVADLERDIKIMQKDHAATFAEFNKKKSLKKRLKEIFSRVKVK